MRFPFSLSNMEVHKAPEPTPEQIQEYKNEKDHDKRIDLAYGYLISSDDLYPEDLKEILADMNQALEEL